VQAIYIDRLAPCTKEWKNCSHLKNIVYLQNKIVIERLNKIVFTRSDKKAIVQQNKIVNIQIE
jgi:hypothetical protein